MPNTSGSGMDDVEMVESSSRKREGGTLVDPDSNTEIVNPKKPKFELDSPKKIKCLASIIRTYNKLINKMFAGIHVATFLNVSTAAQVANIIFTVHNISRQTVMNPGASSNMSTKTMGKEFSASSGKSTATITREEATTIWIDTLKENGLEYKKFALSDKENWYGTIGPYLSFFSAYKLRVDELRIGHHNMPISKSESGTKQFPVSKYGLSGAHHVLLEGCSYPPEKRSSMAQSIGCMTAFLCMVRSQNIYRAKWEDAVKRAFAHIEMIDDIIEITKNSPRASDIRDMVQLLGDISLITTTRQATRMHFPLNMVSFAHSYYHGIQKGEEYLNAFNTSGHGGFLTYKKSQDREWTMNGKMTDSQAAQICFHGIMGTYKEDLSILSEITDRHTWNTREEMKACFQKMGSSGEISKFTLPKFNMYAKLSSAKQTDLLSGVYTQISSIPVFSGRRTTTFSTEFFEHCRRQSIAQGTGRNIPQIVSALSALLEDLIIVLEKKNGKLSMGTVEWRNFEELTLTEIGSVIKGPIGGTPKFFMGKSST